MINPNKEVNRTAGFSVLKNEAGVNVSEIISGQLVRLVDSNTITVADGSLANASYPVYGVAADDTKPHAAGEMFTVLDGYSRNGMVAAYINGGKFEISNDGRGAVFADDCINAPVGSLLYTDSTGKWTVTAGSAGTAGSVALGILEKAPTVSTDTMILQFNM